MGAVDVGGVGVAVVSRAFVSFFLFFAAMAREKGSVVDVIPGRATPRLGVRRAGG